MRNLLKFSWARAVGRAALLVGATVVFVVLILPAAALGSKRAKRAKQQVSCPTLPSTFDISPTKGRPGQEVILRGHHMGNVGDILFKRAGRGWTEASADHLGDGMIRTFVPSDAVSGPVAVRADDSNCRDWSYSSHSFNVK